MSKDYYDILGVSKDASEADIKTAFRKKAHEYHPDKGGDEDKFKEINEAYQVLSNANKRKQYDQFGSAAFSGGAGAGGFNGASGFSNGGFNMDFDDLGDMFGGFSDIFGFGGGSRSSARHKSRGEDLELGLEIDFMEAVFGSEKEIKFSKNVSCENCKGSGGEPGAEVKTCSTCNGSGNVVRIQRTILGNIQSKSICPDCEGEGKTYSKKCSNCGGRGIENKAVKLKVKIPAGIDNGEAIRLSGQGEAGMKGAPAGDLYLRIRVKDDKRFNRDVYDIRTDETISIKQAILGDKIDIETVHGKVKLKIPEGTQSGTIFKLKDKGVSKLRANGFGDHFVRVKVLIPKGLGRKDKKKIEEIDF